MVTTIAVGEDTLDMLRHVKLELKTDNYDQTIRKLVLGMKKSKKSMFGKLKNIKAEFVREKIDRFDR